VRTQATLPPAAPPPPIVAEEQRLLQRIRTTLIENPEGPGRTETDLVEELMRLQEDLREARVDDEKGLINQQIHQLMSLLDQQRKGRPTGTVDPDSPYFAHLRVTEDGRPRDVFLGRATRLEHGLRIVDWRNAPISRLFYQYDQGDEYYEEMGGRMREGVVTARRTVHVDGGELHRVGTSDETWVRDDGSWRSVSRQDQRLAGGEGASLRQGAAHDARLGSGANHRADKHLPDIAALIDPEQFDLITRPGAGVVVLRGSAGSGKTTVALHRIAWLAFELGRSFVPDQVLVIVWGRAMRDYVQHVLPALGVEGVQVTTWTSWARTQVARHFPGLPNRQADDTPEPVTRVKLHPGTAKLLAQVVRKRKGPTTWTQAVEDWAEVITDKKALKRVMGDDISDAALERAIRWNTEQTTLVTRWLDGETDVDARLDTEDDALLLRAHQLRVGPLREKGKKVLAHRHIVLDEVQDFSPVEVQVLLDTCDENQSVTMAGDVRQHISADAGFSSWQEFLQSIGVEANVLSTLEVSYRSTHPIIRFALDVLADDDEPLPRTTRDGPPVELFRFSDHGACVAFLGEELRKLQRAEPNANVALLTPDDALTDLYAAGLERVGLEDVRRVEEQQFAFAPGIDVVEASQVKGLEFDYVVIVEASARYWPDTPHHRRLLHVAATRAVHQLWVTSVATPSPVLPNR
jgi:DNA helicase-2/ATP-dependent DNA helicase PcrA